MGQMTSLLIDHVGSSGTDDKSPHLYHVSSSGRDDKSPHLYHVGSSGTDDKSPDRSCREQWDR